MHDSKLKVSKVILIYSDIVYFQAALLDVDHEMSTLCKASHYTGCKGQLTQQDVGF